MIFLVFLHEFYLRSSAEADLRCKTESHMRSRVRDEMKIRTMWTKRTWKPLYVQVLEPSYMKSTQLSCVTLLGQWVGTRNSQDSCSDPKECSIYDYTVLIGRYPSFLHKDRQNNCQAHTGSEFQSNVDAASCNPKPQALNPSQWQL